MDENASCNTFPDKQQNSSSNDNLHEVNFNDKTEIILSSEHKMLTYVNKKAERSNYPLATALESSNTEMTKRLKYTKEILAHMVMFLNSS